MKYAIMCGGVYTNWDEPKQLVKINGEPIVARTIRLLRQNGIDDIVITSNDDRFNQFGVPVLKHQNDYTATEYNDCTGAWYNCFYPMNEPVCYLFGDVIYSPKAIRTIVEYPVREIMFFASAPPFAEEYPKKYVEPFAFKVVNTERFKQALDAVRDYHRRGRFKREPIAWEVWQVIGGWSLDYRDVDYRTYVHINDYTCDIDTPEDVKLFEGVVHG